MSTRGNIIFVDHFWLKNNGICPIDKVFVEI